MRLGTRKRPLTMSEKPGTMKKPGTMSERPGTMKKPGTMSETWDKEETRDNE